jgi:hypothetical protein
VFSCLAVVLLYWLLFVGNFERLLTLAVVRWLLLLLCYLLTVVLAVVSVG